MKPTKRNREDMKTYVYALLMMGLVKSALPSNTIPTTVPTDVPPITTPQPISTPPVSITLQETDQQEDVNPENTRQEEEKTNSDDGEQSNSSSSVTPTRNGLFLLFLLTANAFL